MNDPFFNKETCDRCGKKLTIRIMSWFNTDCICMECKDKESKLKKRLHKKGIDTQALEGCGYIPSED